MKNLFFLILVFTANFFLAQKIDHNPNRDPILPKNNNGLRVTPPQKISGVQIRTYDGKSLDSNVLFIVDDIETSEEEAKKLNPENILSMEVLKDKNATNLFGEKGKNGVIIIKTKRKRKEKTQEVENQPILAI